MSKNSRSKEEIMKLIQRMNALEAKVENMPSTQGQAVAEAVPDELKDVPQDPIEYTKQVNDEIMETKGMTLKEEYQYLKDNLLVGEKREKKIEKIDRKDELALFEIAGGLEIAGMLLRAENEMNRLILDPAWTRNANNIRGNKVIKVLLDALDHTTKKLSKQTGLFSRTIGATISTIGQKTGNLLTGRDAKKSTLDGVVDKTEYNPNIAKNGGRKKTQRRRLKKQKGAKKTQKRKLKIHN